jgi:hypothetical protein
MSKFRIAMAVAVLASLSASPVLARGFGLGGVIGGVRSVLAHVVPLGIHRGHRAARDGHIHTAALEPQGMPDAALGRRETIRCARYSSALMCAFIAVLCLGGFARAG